MQKHTNGYKINYIISVLVCVAFLIVATSSEAKHLHLEAEYQQYWCGKKGGITEYKLNDKTRVDCLLPDMVVEFDFAPKWAECIGQSLYYGLKTGRQPACVLIMENPEKDIRYLKRLRRVAYKKGIKTFTITPYALLKGIINHY